MAENKVVNPLKADLLRLTADLDRSLANLRLCMIVQPRRPANPNAWILCLVADGLEGLGQLEAISFVSRKLERDYAVETNRAIESVFVLRQSDPRTAALLQEVDSPADAKVLVGRTLAGRVIGRARIFLLRDVEQLQEPRQTISQAAVA